MSSRPTFNFNPTTVRATSRIYEVEGMEMIVGEPSTFFFEGKNGKNDSFGIQFPCTIAEGEFKGEKYNQMLWLHSEASGPMTKQWCMIVLGYDTRTDGEEERYDAEQGDNDWSVNFDDKVVGDGWHQLKGHRVSADFSKGIVTKGDRAGDPQQSVKNWRSVA